MRIKTFKDTQKYLCSCATRYKRSSKQKYLWFT